MISQKVIGIRLGFILEAFVLTILSLIFSCDRNKTELNVWKKIDPGINLWLSNIYFFNDTGIVLGRHENEGDYHSVLLKTTNRGQSWDTTNFPKFYPAGAGFNNIFALSTNILIATSLQYVLSSNNGGRSWQIIDSSICDNACSIGDPVFMNHDTGFVFVGATIFKTTSGGKEFNAVFMNQKMASFHQFQFPNRNTGYISGGAAYDGTDFGFLLKTIDAGNTWQELNFTFKDITRFYFVNTEIGFVFTFDGEIYKTIDGGNSWELMNDSRGAGFYPYVYFSSESDGYYCFRNCIYHTYNSGKSWSKEYQGDDNTESFVGLNFSSPTKGYVIGNNGSILSRTN